MIKLTISLYQIKMLLNKVIVKYISSA